MNAYADVLDRLRGICLALPEAYEQLFGGHTIPTWRVNGKIFAQLEDGHHGNSRLAVWCKAPPGAQDVLVDADPERFYRPPYVGPKGWIGVFLDVPVDWDELDGFLRESYRMTAPKRLLRLIESG
ncbi:MAG: MmcQ/YjbR family DNA-binding protein [Dehalococcoidia bacterium]|nr:MmcQ/YjbR family DNA-binding protein [Dehalococcoidia bacterium]